MSGIFKALITREWIKLTNPSVSVPFKTNNQAKQFFEKDRTMSGIADDKNYDNKLLKDEAAFISNVSQFYNQSELSDIVLNVSGDLYNAHRFVMAKSSPVFKTMLFDKSWVSYPFSTSQNTLKEITLEETSECKLVFDRFLKYLYTANIIVCNSTVVGVLCLADKYDVVSLKSLCVDYMVENTRSPKLMNALAWYPWARLLRLDLLIEACQRTISWNFSDVVNSAEWHKLDIEFLSDFLSSSELIIKSESDIWEAVCSWLFDESRRDQIASNAEILFPLIRFPQMPVSRLYLLESSEFYLERSGCKNLLHELISRAYRFRALCPVQNKLFIGESQSLTFSESFYQPREYLELVADIVRMQNAPRFGIQVDVRAPRSAVPSEIKEADWKITYRKQNDLWTVCLHSHEGSRDSVGPFEMVIQPIIVVQDDAEKVLQVHREDKRQVARGGSIIIPLNIEQPDLAQHLLVFIKPIPT